MLDDGVSPGGHPLSQQKPGSDHSRAAASGDSEVRRPDALITGSAHASQAPVNEVRHRAASPPSPPPSPPLHSQAEPPDEDVVDDLFRVPGLDFVLPPAPTREWSEPPMKGRAPSPYKTVAFARHLRSHPNRVFAEFVVRGVGEGFDCGSECKEEMVVMPPLASAELNPETISEYLAGEVTSARMGKTLKPPHRFCRGIPLGLVSKKPKLPASSKQQVVQAGEDQLYPELTRRRERAEVSSRL